MVLKIRNMIQMILAYELQIKGIVWKSAAKIYTVLIYFFQENHHFNSILLNKFQFCQYVIILLSPRGYFLFGKRRFVLPCPYIFHDRCIYMWRRAAFSRGGKKKVL